MKEDPFENLLIPQYQPEPLGMLPQTDEEVYVFFRQNGSPLLADTLILMDRMQREAFGKSVLDAYRLTLLEYIKVITGNKE